MADGPGDPAELIEALTETRIRAADPHLTLTVINGWPRAGQRMADHVDAYEGTVRAPAWEGHTAGSIITNAARHSATLADQRDSIDALFRRATAAMDHVIATRHAVLDLIGAARTGGRFAVGDDLTVTAADVQDRPAAESTEVTIRQAALKWADAEGFAAGEIHAGAQPLNVPQTALGSESFPRGTGPGTERHRFTGDQLFPHDPTADDVNQDFIGDCYLVATMGAVANVRPQWIRDRIQYDPQTGNFEATLWDGTQWKKLRVTQDDIQINRAKAGGSWLDNGRPDAALWPAVLENAYAQLKFPDMTLGDALHGIGKGGLGKEALEAITGNRGTIFDPFLWPSSTQLDQEIRAALTSHQSVTMATSEDTGSVPFLRAQHQYTVEHIEGVGSDAVVTLRNPWNIDDENPAVFTVKLDELIGPGYPFTNPVPLRYFNIGNF